MAAARTYTKASFRVPTAMADDAAGLLVAEGALGCAVAEMSLPGARERPEVTLEAYFERAQRSRIEQATVALERAGILIRNGHRAVVIGTLTDPGWATMWQWKFAPFRIGRRFLIVPPWQRRHESGRISIAISPGRAFGTGHHPSTASVLRAIEGNTSPGRTPLPRSALDVGTGSGILAIALALAGVERVVAIDIDSEALENARENADLNGVARAIRFSAVPIQSLRGRFDLIIANILATVLTELSGQLVKRLAPGGRLVLSGILASEAPQLRRHYAKLRMRCVEARTSRGWTTLVLKR